MQLTFGQVEAVLARMLRVAPAKLGALRSRLQDLQRMGFPEESRVGRGGRAKYSPESLFKLAVAFELFDVGITPRRAVLMIRENWEQMRLGFQQAAGGDTVAGPERVHITLFPSALLAWREADGAEAELAGVSVTTAREIASGAQSGFLYPLAIIDANGLVARLAEHLATVLGGHRAGPVDDAEQERYLRAWLVEAAT